MPEALGGIDFGKVQAERARMKGAFDENNLVRELLVGQGIENGEASKTQTEREIKEAERVAEFALKKEQTEARMAELPAEMSATERRLLELQANLVKAQADAEKPGKMQKILESIIEGIQKDIATNKASLDDLTAERDFYLLQFGGDETNKQ